MKKRINRSNLITSASNTVEEINILNSQENLLDFIVYTKKDYVVNWHHELICNEIDEFLNNPSLNRLMVFAPPRTGKQLADPTPIFTSLGWTTHGSLVVGDKVLHPSGQFIPVIATSKKSIATAQLTFSNGEIIKCHKNHEWLFNIKGVSSVIDSNYFFKNKLQNTLYNKDNEPIYYVDKIKDIYLLSITELSESNWEEGNCIQVDSKDGLYLVGKTMIPTHNSEILSRRLPAYYLGRNPDSKVIATSYGADLAQANSRDVQRVIDSEEYMKLFPDTKLNSTHTKTTSKRNYIRTADKFEIVDHMGVYKCAGIGGALTGFGASLAIIDDPIKDMQEAMSPKRKEVIYDWYQSVLTTRLVGEEKVIIIMTRWSESDLAGRLLKDAEKDPKADQWRVISLPTLFTEENRYIHPLDPRTKVGQPLWPTMMDEKKANRKKASSGTKVWESLYQQNPTPAGGTIFQSSWFQYYKDMPDFDYTAASWDFTFKDTKSSDFVAGGVWGIAGPNKYLIYLIRQQLDFVGSIKVMLKVNNLFHNLRYNLVEDKANGPAIISTLKTKIGSIIAYSPKEGKEARANAVQPQYEAGNVWLPDMYYGPNRTQNAWALGPADISNPDGDKLLDHYIKEHIQFPYAAHDDAIDMTSQFLLKVGGGVSWLEELVKDEKPKSEQDKQTEKLAEIMGWNLE